MSRRKTTARGRDARDGEFRPVKWAREHPSIGVVEQVPLPGYGDTGRSKKRK